MPLPKLKSDSIYDTLKSMRWAFSIFWQLSPLLTLTYTVFTVILSFMNIFNNYMFGWVIDKLIAISTGAASTDWIYALVGIFFLLSVISSIFRLLSRYAMRTLREWFYPKYRQIIYEKLIKLGIQTLEDPDVNNLIERARQNSNYVHIIFDNTVNFVGVLATFLGSGFVLVTFAPHFIPIILLALIPSILIDRKFMRKIWQYNRNIVEERRSAFDSASYLQNSKSLHELVITNGTKKLSDHFEKFINSWVGELSDIRKKWFSVTFIMQRVRNLIEAYADFTVFIRFIRGSISIGEVTFYIRQVSSFISSISNLASSINGIYESSLNVREARDLFALAEPEDGKESLEDLNKGPEININNLGFSYPNSNKKVLKNIDLSIESGEKVAIVGHNGAGKTTLVKLLMRFYSPDSGEIWINDNKLSNLKISSWYKNVSVLFQEYNTYHNLNLEDNIKIGNLSKKNKTELKRATKLAEVDDLVSQFEKGYKQILSEKYKGGIRPSTGQWQKIAIARFFYRNAPLVIFDEPTAAIDAVAEAKIFNRIYKFFKGKTVIIISHRFSTVRNADRIIVFDKGKIVEQGSHDELIKMDGKYAKAFKLQAKGYK